MNSTKDGPDRFPVLWPYRREREKRFEEAGCPRYVPWVLVAAHETQAKDNHDQSLKTLARRGGLCPHELVAVLTDRCWTKTQNLSDAEAVAQLLELLKMDTVQEAK